ncbi:MAG: hypothetical protein OEW75_03280 [Cyclobacteriaceae bacterium]|nr:hypothetical protein [Cyclobacteriaceae bacterium]
MEDHLEEAKRLYRSLYFDEKMKALAAIGQKSLMEMELKKSDNSYAKYVEDVKNDITRMRYMAVEYLKEVNGWEDY